MSSIHIDSAEIPAVRVVTRTATQFRTELFRLVDRVYWRKLVVLITRRGRQTLALVPLEIAKGRGVTLVKRNIPVAALIKVRVQVEDRS